jgi:hypothetical protein
MSATVRIHSLVLDIDTVLDVADYLKSQFPDAIETFSISREGPVNTVPREALRTISEADRRRLTLSVHSSTMGGGFVTFVSGVEPTVNVYPNEDTLEAVIRILQDSGKARIEWTRLYKWLPWVLYALLAAAWVWLVSSTPLPVAGVILGFLVVAFLAVVAQQVFAAIQSRWAGNFRGHLIRNESRLETYARRASSHRDLRVSAISVVATIVAGVVVAYLTGAIG